MDVLVKGWAPWLVAALLIATLIVPVARFVETSAQWLPHPYPRAGSEGLILYESLLVKRGDDIYAPITLERFISGPYPPVYYWLAAWLLPDTLPDFSTPATVSSIFTPGRIVSLIATLVTAVLIALFVLFGIQTSRRGEPSVRPYKAVFPALIGGTIGGLIFLTLPQTMVWATRFRGDMLTLAFTAAGLVCIAYAGSREKAAGSGDEGRRAEDVTASSLQPPAVSPSVLDPQSSVLLLLAALFFALAFYTKQTAIAGPIAASAYLLLRDWRVGLKWCAAMLMVVGVPFAILEIATGHWFYLKMVDYHALPLRAGTLTRLLQFALLEDSWPLLLVAAGFMLYRFISRPSRITFPVSLLILLFLATTLLTLPTGAVVGADHNHLLMVGMAIAASVGAACAWVLARLTSGERFPLAQWMAAPLIAGLVLVYAIFTASPSAWYEPDLAVPSPAVQEQLRLIVQNARNNPGRLIFSDDPGIVALAGKETPYNDPFTMAALAQQGRWDESAFRAMLREGRFALLVLQCNVIEAPQACRYDTLTPGAADAIREGYRVLFRDVLFTYAPK